MKQIVQRAVVPATVAVLGATVLAGCPGMEGDTYYPAPPTSGNATPTPSAEHSPTPAPTPSATPTPTPTSTPAPTPTPTATPTPPVIKFTLSASAKSYQKHEPVKLTMTARNTTGQPQEVTFGSGQSFDVTATDSAGKNVWNWSHGRFFTMMVREVTLPANSVQTFTATWDQTANDGKLAPRGTYTLTGRFRITGGGVASAPVTIELK